MDSNITQDCARNLWGYLISQGVEVYEYKPAMYHTKVMIIDDHLVIAGASNLDYRSFFINDENNFHVYNSDFARSQRRDVEKDLRYAKKITLENLQSFSVVLAK